MYESRYRPRHRTNPLVAIVGILILALATGGILLAGGAFVGRSLVAVAGPQSTSPGPVAAVDGSRAPDATGPTPTRRPRGTTAPDPTSIAEEVGGVEVDDPVDVGPVGEASVAPEPSTTPRPWADLRPRPRPGPFSMDIYKDGALASEALPEWCVPAAMLTMINIMKKGRPNTSAAEQKRLYYLARRYSTDRLTGAGAEPEGWAEGLNREGYGPYIVQVEDSRRLAVREAARALRFTGRPVGLLAWRGAHSWVMTGFKATADPAYTRDFEVTDVVIADVWWPRVSTIWGASNPPGSLVPFERLPEDYLAWRRPDVAYPEKDGRFVLVIPVRDDGRYDPSARGR